MTTEVMQVTFSKPTQERLDEIRRERFGDEAGKLSDETLVYLLCEEMD